MIKTLLLIDDQPDDQYLYQRIIKKSGMVETLHQFLLAREAIEFLAAEDRPTIDAIFLDINMPEMDGFEFLEAATQRFGGDFAKVGVIMLTTSLAPSDRERANSYPIVKAYINKPLEKEHLNMVADMLASEGY